MLGNLRYLYQLRRSARIHPPSKSVVPPASSNSTTQGTPSSKPISGNATGTPSSPSRKSGTNDPSNVIAPLEHRHWTSRLRTLLQLLKPNDKREIATTPMSDQSIPQTNEACCQIAPVQNDGYEPKGKKVALSGYTDVYVVGPEDSKTAVIALFDIFGFYPQTQQGADIVSEALNAKVYMPDVFFNDPCPLDIFPPKNDQDKQTLGNFFKNQAAFDRVMPGLLDLAKLLRNGGVETLYFYGLCWGGKVATLIGGETYDDNGQNRPFVDAVAGLHPAMLSAPDAEKLLVPIAIYASKDEPLDEYKKMVENLGQKPFASKNAYRVYPTMHHGWGGARADLNNPDNKEQFADVYGRLATFFKNATAK